MSHRAHYLLSVAMPATLGLASRHPGMAMQIAPTNEPAGAGRPTPDQAAHLRAFAINALRAMAPAFSEHPQFCERVLQSSDALKDDPEIYSSLRQVLAAAGSSPFVSLGGDGISGGMGGLSGGPDIAPGLQARRSGETVTPRASDAPPAQMTSSAELYQKSMERKNAAKMLWESVCHPAPALLHDVLLDCETYSTAQGCIDPGS